MIPPRWSVFLLAIAAVACSAPSGSDGPVRHVVFISLDTTRPDHFGFYGSPKVRTPNLDKLASESIVLDDFMTVAPTTLASHASLFTGKYPHSHGTPRNGFMVHEDNVLLAEILHEAGFSTAGFVGAFPLASQFGIAQGFDHWDEEFERFEGVDAVLVNERTAESVTDAVIRYLDEVDLGRKQFLFVHYFDPHAPYESPSPYDTLYDPQGRDGLRDWLSLVRDCHRLSATRTQPPEELVEEAWRMAAQYAAEVTYTDVQVGRLLANLRERGMLDDALLVVTSDHGESFWEHGECFDHGWNTYDSTMRIVGLIRLPGAAGAGTRVPGLLTNLDVLPTVLDYLGIAVPEAIDGKAMDLESASPKAPGGPRFGQATKPWQSVETDPRWHNLHKSRCIRQGKLKLIQVPTAGMERLYDLSRDPIESVNLLGTPNAEVDSVVGPMRRKLETWAASADPLPTYFVPGEQNEVIERLRALGYLGGDEQ